MIARITDNGSVSEAFAVTNGVKQGCALAPTLFSLMFSAMLMDAYRDEQPGIRIAYRTDGHLLNSRRMQAPTRVSTTTVHDLLFADDCALNTVTEEDVQRSMDLFAAGCTDFGLTISTAKTVVMHQPPPSVEYNAPRINVNVGLFQLARPWTTTRTGELNQVRVSGVVCDSTSGMSISRTYKHLPASQKSFGKRESNQLDEVGVGFNFFWSGRPKAERRDTDSTALEVLGRAGRQQQRWFDDNDADISVLNCSSAISDAAIERLTQMGTNNDLDLPHSLPETAGPCNRFPAEKHRDPTQSRRRSKSKVDLG
ncbi:unnamed protein product [Schistocephalus solidus]|uniref:Reverse transcriptase domain-containing protein n=1 Tax=Schistocephalus solidus TaxID=70667 RepID=A0A183SEP0_SCHSO|nr:unnamed protein product [Schistocephalus solidus]